MSSELKLDRRFLGDYISSNELEAAKDRAVSASKALCEKSGEGGEFLGWVDLPEDYDREEYARIKKAAEKIRGDSEVFVVIGIGGSYLGARAAVEFLRGPFAKAADGPEIYFLGNSISADALSDMIKAIGDRDFSVNVISKSGTTTEPAIAFRILKGLLLKKYGREGSASRIYATTDKLKGALRTLACAEGYERFTVPDDVGGRYSVLTAVGLLPIAVAGIDTDALLKGAGDMRRHALSAPFEKNAPLLYASCRNILYEKGRKIELLADFEPYAHYVAEWWKQLFGESEGKDHKGIFPASVDFTTDLHSMGQYIQDGERIIMETVLDIENSQSRITVESEENDLDGLNYLSGADLNEINHQAMHGTILAHAGGGVPIMRVSVEGRDAYSLGQLFYFFMYACGVSGYMLGVNPFNQPGVEDYKKNMFALLGKPGYEKLSAELRKRI